MLAAYLRPRSLDARKTDHKAVTAMPVIGCLSNASPSEFRALYCMTRSALGRRALRTEPGWVRFDYWLKISIMR